MNKKKRIILLVVIIVVVILVVVIWYSSSTQWTRDFDIKYVEYVRNGSLTDSSDYSYYLYEITNTTHRTLKDVSVVISVDNIYGEFKYEDSVKYSIKPGETVEYKIYNKDYETEANDRGIKLGLLSVSSVDIVEIKYSS